MEHFIGKRVKCDVINAYGVTIVPIDSVINQDALKLMLNHRINIESVIVNDTVPAKDSSVEMVRQTVSKAKDLFLSIAASRKVPLLEIRKEVLPYIQDISKNPNIFALFEAVRAKDDYTYQHNIGVGVLSTLIGGWMNFDEAELSLLSLAATLHDVGKVKVPIEILNKPGKLTDAEIQQIRKHTVYGYELLKETTGLSARVALVALQHHEREDGNGYPLGLKRGSIDPLSSVVAVADIFHAMTSKRPYHDPMPFYEIVSQMGRGQFGELNPYVVSVFIENMMRRVVGKQVVLTDGRQGEVVLLNPHSIETPLVKIGENFLDLNQERSLHIKEIIAL